MEFSNVLILSELPMHPNSYLDQIRNRFEKPSVITVSASESLRGISKAPIFNDRYLVIFEGVSLFKDNIGYIKLDIMLPIVRCTSRSTVKDVQEVCQAAKLPYRIINNPFEKGDAVDMVFELSKCKASKTFCEALVRRVGKSPQRIISAMTALEDLGYTTGNITKYVDKYVYIRPSDVIMCLLGLCSSGAQARRAATYLHSNRLWYAKYTKAVLVEEVDFILRVYSDALSGKLTRFNMLEYLEENRLFRFRVSSALDLIELKSVTELMSLKLFLEKATLLEVAIRLM